MNGPVTYVPTSHIAPSLLWKETEVTSHNAAEDLHPYGRRVHLMSVLATKTTSLRSFDIPGDGTWRGLQDKSVALESPAVRSTVCLSFLAGRGLLQPSCSDLSARKRHDGARADDTLQGTRWAGELGPATTFRQAVCA